MPNLIEIAALLEKGTMGLADLGRKRFGRKMAGIPSHQALKIAEKQLEKGNRPLAIAWAVQAGNKARAEGRDDVAQRADDIVKMVRGQAMLKVLAEFGDVDGVIKGRVAGLW